MTEADKARIENAKLRERIRGLFSNQENIKQDAIEAIEEAWELDKPAFNLEEMRQFDSHIVALSAMRRDTVRELITWLKKI